MSVRVCVMNIMWLLVVLVSALTVCKGGSTKGNSTVFGSYSKETGWGANDRVEGSRRHGGHSLWSQRVDANIVRSEGSKENVVRQYPVYMEKDTVKAGVGEVIQDRFNVRPYFGYGEIPPKSQDSATFAPPQPLPAFNSNGASPSSDPYMSPYTSYNPPAKGVSYPPAVQASASPDGYNYGKPNVATLGPPLSPGKETDAAPSDYDGRDDADSDGFQISDDEESSKGDPPKGMNDVLDEPQFPKGHQSPKDAGNPPKHPPKSIDDVYYPDYSGLNGNGYVNDMTMDLSPPDDSNFKYPQYMYDNSQYDHHVYEEVPHTTEATKKRVSGGHYSYYYLGRKLFYIPLYFSIYFIIYVMILLVKAVARHKVQYKQGWLSTHSRTSKKLAMDSMEKVDEVHKNVTSALDNFTKNYSRLAM